MAAWYNAGMTQTDQPTIFDDHIVCAFSDRHDGSMLEREHGRHAPEAVDRRRRWLDGLQVAYDSVAYQAISYADGGTFNSYALVDGRSTLAHEPMGIQADALITATPGVYLFLPVADCVATALYDPEQQVVATLHLGRHSTVTNLVARVVWAMEHDFGCRPANLRAWLSPSVQQASYELERFDQAADRTWAEYVDQRDGKFFPNLSGYNRGRLVAAGLRPEHIEVSAIDTATSEDYFCHSRGDRNGRMALVLGLRG